MNGWKRAWLVLTGIGLVGAVLFSAFAGLSHNTGWAAYEYENNLKSDLSSDKCTAYILEPLETLIEPRVDTPCYTIYSARSYDRAAPIPYTIERYNAQQAARRWEQFGIAIAVLGTVVLFTSALTYLAGYLIAWIRNGFRDEDSDEWRRTPNHAASPRRPPPPDRSRGHSQSEEFIGLRSPRATNFGYAALMGFFSFILFWLSVSGTEKSLLNAHGRRAGIVKLIEQLMGWELFSTMLMIGSLPAGVAMVIFLWKAIYAKPDLRAFDDGMDFHPVVKLTGVSYEDVDHWTVTKEDGMVLTIQLYDRYWSLRGIVPRKSLRFERTEAELKPLVLFWYDHPVMGRKLID